MPFEGRIEAWKTAQTRTLMGAHPHLVAHPKPTLIQTITLTTSLHTRQRYAYTQMHTSAIHSGPTAFAYTTHTHSHSHSLTHSLTPTNIVGAGRILRLRHGGGQEPARAVPVQREAARGHHCRRRRALVPKERCGWVGGWGALVLLVYGGVWVWVWCLSHLPVRRHASCFRLQGRPRSTHIATPASNLFAFSHYCTVSLPKLPHRASGGAMKRRS